jgi:hypothetical protein
MAERTEQILGYVIFLGTAVMGLTGVAWWAALAPVLLLVALRYGTHARLARKHGAVGEERVLTLAITLTLINSAVFVALAFALGRAIAFVFA